MVFAKVSAVVTLGKKTDKTDRAVRPSFHFCVRGSDVTFQAVRCTNIHEDTIFTDDAHKSPFTERSWLLFAGTTEIRVWKGPLGRWSRHRTAPTGQPMASAVRFITDLASINCSSAPGNRCNSRSDGRPYQRSRLERRERLTPAFAASMETGISAAMRFDRSLVITRTPNNSVLSYSITKHCACVGNSQSPRQTCKVNTTF